MAILSLIFNRTDQEMTSVAVSLDGIVIKTLYSFETLLSDADCEAVIRTDLIAKGYTID